MQEVCALTKSGLKNELQQFDKN